MSAIEIPDTPLVREARNVVEAALPGRLVAHSVRCGLLGRAFGRARSLDFDEEGLFLAALFHDVGLGPAHRDARRAFTLNSSRELRTFLLDRAVPEERIEPMGEAIELHMQLRPRWERGPLAGLLQVAAWMDVAGLRRGRIADDARAIATAFPRDGLTLTFARHLLLSLRSWSACTGLWWPPPKR